MYSHRSLVLKSSNNCHEVHDLNELRDYKFCRDHCEVLLKPLERFHYVY